MTNDEIRDVLKELREKNERLRAILAMFVPDDPFCGDVLSGGPSCVGCWSDRFNGHAPDCRWEEARKELAKS